MTTIVTRNETGVRVITKGIQGPPGVAAPVVPRAVALTDEATVTPNIDTTDIGVLASLSQNTTIANPSGTPLAGQKFMLRIKSTTSRALVFGAQYRGSTNLPLPSATTGSSKWDYLGFIWNATDSKWDYLAKNFGF